MDACRSGSALFLLLSLLAGCGPDASSPPSGTAPAGEAAQVASQTPPAPAAASAPDAPPVQEPPQDQDSAPVSPAGTPDPAAARAPAEDPPETPRQDPPIAELLRDLVGDDLARRETAAAQLEELAARRRTSLVAAMQAPDARVRQAAAFFFLDRFQADDVRVIEAYTRQLADPDPEVRKIALVAANRFPPQVLAASAPQLASVLGSPDHPEANRATAARLLAKLPEKDQAALAALATAAREDPAIAVRAACVQSLVRIAPPEQTVRVLGDVLSRDADKTVRRLAAMRMGRLGPPAAASLAAALGDADEEVRIEAARSLAALGTAAVAPLVGQLQHADPQVRMLALSALGALGSAAADAADSLRPLLQDPDPAVRDAAHRVLLRLQR